VARSLLLAIAVTACGSRGPVAESVGSGTVVAVRTLEASGTANAAAIVLAQLNDSPPPTSTCRPHRPTEGGSGSLVVIGADAVAQDPSAALFVDSRARSISAPRRLLTRECDKK
jgi:hypothetical protein